MEEIESEKEQFWSKERSESFRFVGNSPQTRKCIVSSVYSIKTEKFAFQFLVHELRPVVTEKIILKIELNRSWLPFPEFL